MAGIQEFSQQTVFTNPELPTRHTFFTAIQHSC